LAEPGYLATGRMKMVFGAIAERKAEQHLSATWGSILDVSCSRKERAKPGESQNGNGICMSL
jgi:hypothetical protein